jgi:nucleoside recognition membrane protein YjiH
MSEVGPARAALMWDRIESLSLIFCGLALLYLVMRPGTETLLGRVFPWWLKAFLTSLLQAVCLSVILFGMLGVFSHSGVTLIGHYPIVFIVIAGIGTALLLWGNITNREYSSTL